MPFAIRKHGKAWEVYNEDTGERKGLHPSEEEAKAQLRALYANVPDAKKKED